jgi:hypothetical protein
MHVMKETTLYRGFLLARVGKKSALHNCDHGFETTQAR